jgi:SAM-dependent methyltransferase
MKTITACRACDGTDLTSVLDLGHQPLANRFVTEEQCEWEEPRYPLHLVRCLTCGLAQLDTVVDPKILYGPSYPYRSGYSEGWRQHCRELAEEILRPCHVLEIGCLDGVFMRTCMARGFPLVVGVDPSAPDTDLLVSREFFGRTWRWPLRPVQEFDVIVAQNVLGHVDDPIGFLQGVAANLRPHGLAVIECPDAIDLFCEGRWDTIYHEHLSYWGFGSLNRAALRAGLILARVRSFPHIHGGTTRYYLSPLVSALQDRSIVERHAARGPLDAETYQRFAIRAYGDMKRWDTYLQNPQRKAIAAYGASAKLNTFLNALPNRPSIVGVFDDNPHKWNLYTPGWHFPVLKPTAAVMQETDVLLIGASNWKSELEAKARGLGFTGEVVSLW